MWELACLRWHHLGSSAGPSCLHCRQASVSLRTSGLGWPWSYYGGHVGVRVQPPRPDKVAQAIAPDYALGTHVAPLGLAFSDARGMPAAFANGEFVGEHGSWNRNPQAGYKVVFIAFKDGEPAGTPVDFLTGFLNASGEAQGRSVGVTLDGQGALLVADDVGNTVWRVAQRKPWAAWPNPSPMPYHARASQ